MAFGMFSSHASPIAVDFGASSIKMLQIGGEEQGDLLAAAEIAIPGHIRDDREARFEYYADQIPRALHQGKFKGKRVVSVVPSSLTHIQHMQISPTEGVASEELVKAQLQVQLGINPTGVVVRSVEVEGAQCGAGKREMICLAMARDTVMQFVNLLKRCKLEVVGVHTELQSITRAFSHLYRREGDDQITTLYVDLGWGGTRAAITHGTEMVFSRYIQIGGYHFDKFIADHLHCDVESAHTHRLALQTEHMVSEPVARRSATPKGSAILQSALHQADEDAQRKQTETTATVAEDRRSGSSPTELSQTISAVQFQTTQGVLDMSEPLSTLTDELCMCLRYHQGLFPERSIDRVIFVGGEARQMWLCQHVVRELRLPAQLGDPLARLTKSPKLKTPGVSLGEPQPGWTLPYGLCNAPTDL